MRSLKVIVRSLALGLLGASLLVSLAAPAQGYLSADQLQSKADSLDFSVGPSFDIRNVDFRLKSNGDFNIEVAFQAAAIDVLIPPQSIEISLDTDGDSRSNIIARPTKSTDTWNKADIWFFYSVATGEQLPCVSSRSAYGAGRTNGALNEGTIYLSTQLGCLPNLGERLGVSITTTPNGVDFDYFPAFGKFHSFKTSFLAVAGCDKKSNKKKVKYLGTTYQCNQKSKKWVWSVVSGVSSGFDGGTMPNSGSNSSSVKPKYNKSLLPSVAYYECGFTDLEYIFVKLGDRGKTLVVSSGYNIVASKKIDCILNKTKAPSSVRAKLDITRALDGMVEASWGRLSAFWNYHPDKGLDLVISQD